jgi:hypothetical protein
MPVCDACGAEVDGGARFCGECGALVRAQNPRDTVTDVRSPVKPRTPPGAKNKGKDAGKESSKARPVKPPERTAEAKVAELRSTIRGVSTSAMPASPAPIEPIRVGLDDPGCAEVVPLRRAA